MKLYVNVDKHKELAVETSEKLAHVCSELSMDIVDEALDADLICSIGGDGTFLQSSKLSPGCPMFGINCGTLGYLTDVNPEDISKALKDVLDNKYYVEERMMLDAQIIREDGKVIPIKPALNEISVSKNTFGVVRFDTIIDGKLINSYTADGIIVCTPTGSTAYNLSCGGPIVDPTAHIITVTPIAPHTILNRSLVFSDNSIVEIKITELRGNTTSYVLSDGKAIEITAGDTVRIKKSSHITKIIKFNWQSFVDNIRAKIK